MTDTIRKQNVLFYKINEQSFQKIDTSDLRFFMISQSGVIDTPGNIYLFTHNKAFFMEKTGYKDDFIDEILSIVPNWNLINVYFCDFLIINPTIYDSFVKKLCTKNNRYFWFETAIDIYKNDKI